jgi:hypothetical protein
MRRLNPWIVIPAVLVGLLVGWLGWIATDVSCRADQAPGGPGCPLAATVVGIVCLIGATIGLTVVLALTGRSIGEYRTERDRQR